MQPRQKLLMGSLVAAIVGLLAIQWGWSEVFKLFDERATSIAKVEESIKKNEDQQLLLARAQKSLKEFKSISFPPDPGKSKQPTNTKEQPTAINAQRLYIQWLTDLGQLCGFESLNVAPGGMAAKGPAKGSGTNNVYITLTVKIDAEARYDQLVMFLDLFYRTKLLHRITKLNVTTKVFDGDPIMKVSIDAEGLALVDAAPRRTLFPQTALTEDLSENGTTLEVSEPGEFPKEPGFRIQIKGEYLKVTGIDGTKLTVERAVERMRPDPYLKGTTVDLVQMNPKQSERTLEEFRQLIASNIFVKPAPPYKIKVGPLTEKTFTRGRSNDYTIPVQGYDSQKGRPEFSIVGSAPTGLKLDKFGKITWRPSDDVAISKYPVKFQIRHPSAPDGMMTETLTIRVREPNKPPKLAAETAPKVLLNQQWTYLPALVTAESTPTQYSWKLGDKPPKGITINSKTGELKWTPGDDVEIGPATIPLVLTDNDSPPQSSNVNLKIDVQDDAAEFTRLTGIVALGDKKRIFLTDQSKDQKTELHEGDKFSISELSGTIKRIGSKSVLITLGSNEARWEIGQSLREVQASMKEYAARNY